VLSLKLQHEHPWDLSPQEAHHLQEQLRAYIMIEALPEESIQSVGAVDASFGGNRLYAAAVVLDYATLEPIDQVCASAPLTFPYIPGLLSFQESPAIPSVLARLKQLPDVLIVDGHGYAHPRVAVQNCWKMITY
jgi:deoxyribonuclease V